MCRAVKGPEFWNIQATRFRDMGMTASVLGYASPATTHLKVQVPADDKNLESFLSKANGLRPLGLVAIDVTPKKAADGPKRIFEIRYSIT